MYLHNAYLEYVANGPEERKMVLKKWLRHLLFLKTLPEEFEDVVHDLLPSLRTRGYFEMTQLRFRAQNRDMPHFPYQDIGENFGLALSYDMHDSILIISEKHLDDWGISFYEAMEIAMRNLQERECVFTCLRMEDQMRVYISTVGDSFDGTRLVLTEPIRGLEVLGDTVALVLSTDSLLITGSEDEMGLSFFLAQAMESHEKPHAVPPLLLRLEGDDWQPWLPEKSSRFYLPFKRFRVLSLATDYAEQQGLLEHLHRQSRNDVLVAKFFVAQNEKQEDMFTYTVWNPESESLLPEAEYVAFIEKPNAPPLLIPWPLAAKVVGYLMQPQSDYPPRYLVESYPSRKELEEMKYLLGEHSPLSQNGF